MGINIDGERLHHLRFEVDGVLKTDNLGEVRDMILDLQTTRRKINPIINFNKTKIMTNLVPIKSRCVQGR